MGEHVMFIQFVCLGSGNRIRVAALQQAAHTKIRGGGQKLPPQIQVVDHYYCNIQRNKARLVGIHPKGHCRKFLVVRIKIPRVCDTNPRS